MSDYTVTEYSFDEIPLAWVGYYQESIVLNHSNHTIYIIDKHGNKIDLPAHSNQNSRLEVEIRYRTTTGSRAKDARTLTPKALPGVMIKVPIWSIEAEPVYIKELDILLCSASNVGNAQHPCQAMNYRDVIEHAIREFTNSDKMYTLRVFANTEDKSLNELFVSFAGYRGRVSVTHYTGYSELILILTNGINRVPIVRIDISKIEQNIVLPLEDGNLIFVSRSPNDLDQLIWTRCQELAMLSQSKEQSDIVIKQLQSQMDELHKHHKTILEVKAAEHKLAIEQHKFDTDNAKHALEMARAENTKQKIQIDKYEGLLAADTFNKKQDQQVREAEFKTKSAAINLDSDTVKFKETCIKVGLGVIMLIAGIVLKAAVDNAKKK